MAWTKTKVCGDPLDVEIRLSELGLSLPGLIRARDVALSQAANITPYHCANAAGTFAYHFGVWALRDEFVGEHWRVDRTQGVEAIFNKSLSVRVAFSNVDKACDNEHEPKPRSAKGSGAEQLCVGNLFGDLPRYAPSAKDGIATYYLMCDSNGALELSRPVVSANTFSAFIERIYLSSGGDRVSGVLPLDENDAVEDFNPQVIRK
jgi:hypothetical protein